MHIISLSLNNSWFTKAHVYYNDTPNDDFWSL